MKTALLYECQDCGKLVEFTSKEPKPCSCCVDDNGIYVGSNKSGKNEFKLVEVKYTSNIIVEETSDKGAVVGPMTKLGTVVQCVVTGNIGTLIKIDPNSAHYLHVIHHSDKSIHKYSSNTLREYVGEEPINTSRIVNVTESLNRDKVLDEGIFLALCGLEHCREGSEITGVVRLEMAKHKIGAVIDKINDKLNNGEFPKDSCD